MVVEIACAHTPGPAAASSMAAAALGPECGPALEIQSAATPPAALERLRPGRTAEFPHSVETLRSDLEALQRQMELISEIAKDRPILFSHPVYQYFARRCELNARSVHWEPDELPSDLQWDELKSLLNGHPARCMIWEKEPLQETVAALAELGVESITFSTCGNVPPNGDYLFAQQENLKNLTDELKETN